MKITVNIRKDVEIEINDRWKHWDIASLEKNQTASEHFQQEIKQQINLPFADEWDADTKDGMINEVWANDGYTLLYEY